MGIQNRGVHKGAAGRFTDFGVNRQTNMHSCLLEVGYISSAKDNKAFDSNLDKIAKAIVISTMSVCGVDYIEPVIKGDVNGDGKVTADDARKALRASAKLENLTNKETLAADINGDGKVTADDARKALRASAKLENLNEKEKSAADINGDGKVTADDARTILRKSAKLE